jgi:hypothetical protein
LRVHRGSLEGLSRGLERACTGLFTPVAFWRMRA